MLVERNVHLEKQPANLVVQSSRLKGERRKSGRPSCFPFRSTEGAPSSEERRRDDDRAEDLVAVVTTPSTATIRVAVSTEPAAIAIPTALVLSLATLMTAEPAESTVL